MCPQIACPRGGKVTLVAFVWLFCTMRFQMSPQIPCLRWYIVTLVANVAHFSTFQIHIFCAKLIIKKSSPFSMVFLVRPILGSFMLKYFSNFMIHNSPVLMIFSNWAKLALCMFLHLRGPIWKWKWYVLGPIGPVTKNTELQAIQMTEGSTVPNIDILEVYGLCDPHPVPPSKQNPPTNRRTKLIVGLA